MNVHVQMIIGIIETKQCSAPEDRPLKEQVDVIDENGETTTVCMIICKLSNI